MITFTQLVAWRDMKAEIERTKGAEMFLGKPKNWFEDLHFFCQNGHVSGSYLNDDGTSLCFECSEPVIMGPKMGEAAFAKDIANGIFSNGL